MEFGSSQHKGVIPSGEHAGLEATFIGIEFDGGRRFEHWELPNGERITLTSQLTEQASAVDVPRELGVARPQGA